MKKILVASLLLLSACTSLQEDEEKRAICRQLRTADTDYASTRMVETARYRDRFHCSQMD